MKKQLTAWLLSLVMLFSLIGCGAAENPKLTIRFE